MRLILILAVLLVTANVDASKVLMLPMLTKSHVIEMKALVSCEHGDHLHTADSYYDLEKIKMDVAATICESMTKYLP